MDISAEADRAEQQDRRENHQNTGHSRASNEQLHEVEPRPTSEQTPLLNDSRRGRRSRSEQYDADELIVYYSEGSAKVRIIRWALILLAFVLATWIVLEVCNMFVSIPFFDSPGSGFLELDLAVLALVEDLITLRFFVSPTHGDFVLSSASWLALAIDAVLVATVPTLRHRHVSTASGIVTVLVELVTFSLAAWAQWSVLDLHRHAGRPSRGGGFKRWFKHSVSFSLQLAVTALTIALTVLVTFRAFSTMRGMFGPQELTNVHNGKFGVYLKCTPTVTNKTILVEGGERTTAEQFAQWIRESTDEQVCYWDRPGYGRSDNAPSPQSMGTIVDTLNEALATVDTSDEFVLVSHSTGGLASRLFASRHTDQISTIMLVETVHEQLYFDMFSFWFMLKSWLQGVITGPLSNDRQAKARIQQQISSALTRSEIESANTILQDTHIPLAVVSSAKSIERSEKWSEGQRQLTKVTKNNVAWSILDGGHELWKDEKSRRELQVLLNDVIKFSS